MSTAATLLRQARTATGTTQRDLAARARSTQAAITDVETSRHDPGVERLSRFLGALGYRLTVLPATAASAADTAEYMRACLAGGDE